MSEFHTCTQHYCSVHHRTVHILYFSGNCIKYCICYNYKSCQLLAGSTSIMTSPSLVGCLGSRQADSHCSCGRAEYRQAYIAACTTHTHLSAQNIWESLTYTLYSRSCNNTVHSGHPYSHMSDESEEHTTQELEIMNSINTTENSELQLATPFPFSLLLHNRSEFLSNVS